MDDDGLDELFALVDRALDKVRLEFQRRDWGTLAPKLKRRKRLRKKLVRRMGYASPRSKGARVAPGLARARMLEILGSK